MSNSLKVEMEKKVDPMTQFGLGIHQYFKVLKYMMIIYFVFSLFSYVLISIYSSYDGLNTPEAGIFNKNSMGNMIYAGTYCFNQLFEYQFSTLDLKCTNGLIGPEIIHFGLLPDKLLKSKKNETLYRNYCGSDENLESTS